MKNKKQCINAEDEKYEDREGAENEENSSCSPSILSDEDDRCPICLNCLAEQEVAFPENCSHIFCMTCILKWAETRASCPVDRKQFQAVYKLCALEDCIKVQIKQPLSKADDLLSCNEGKYCPMNMKNCIRRPLTANSYKSWNQKHNSSNKEDKNSVSVKKKEPRRQTCSNRFFRSNLCDRFSSSSSFVGESPSYHNECIEIDTIIGHKRRELELSCSVLARIARIPSMCHETQTETCALVSTSLGTLFPIRTAPLENIGSFKKGHVVTYVQEGEEKKQTSGTAGTRGSRRKISDTTPRRRSARNAKTESLSQSQNSPPSSSSGCEASGDGSSFVNASCAESEKKMPPKRKGKRGVKQQEPFVKKRLRSSGSYEKSSDIVEEGESETDKTLLVDKDSMPDIENSSSGFSHKSDVETQSANGLETSEDLVKSEELTKDKEQDTLDIQDTGSCLQEPPLLTPEEDTDTFEIKDDTQFENQNCYENAVEQVDNPEKVSREALCDDTATCTHQLQELDSPRDELRGKPAICLLDSPGIGVLEKSEDMAIADETLTCPGNELLVEMGSVIDRPLSNPKNEFLREPESVSVAEESLPVPRNELLQEPEAVTTVNEILEMSRNEIPEGQLPQPTELVTVANEPLYSPRSNLQEIPMSLEMEEAKPEEKEANTDNERGPVLLMDNYFNQSSEQAKQESRTGTSPKALDTEEVKCFSENSNVIIAMECDSLSSDQNEPRIDQPQLSGNVEQEADSVLQDIEHSVFFSSSSDKKEEMECNTELKKDKKSRTRRSRFHSPSTTWSPSKREGRKSQSPSPKREIVTEGRTSRSPKRNTSEVSLSHSPKKDPSSEVRSPSCSPKRDYMREAHRSPSCSPKRDCLKEVQRSPSCSPKRDSPREGRRSSRNRGKECSPRHKGRSQSRDRDSDKDCPRRDHDRERSRRRWSQSRSRSRSRSRPRSKGPSFPRSERDGYSPPRWKERWTNDSWRSPKGNDRYKRNDQEKREHENRARESANKNADRQCFSDQYRKDYPDWVMERINSVPETRNTEREKMKNPNWEENRHNNSGPPWNRNFGSGWHSNRGRGGRGRGGRGRGGFTYGDHNENRWKPQETRKPQSGNANNSGNESSRFSEHQPYKRKTEQDFSFDSPADRSGWSSASSWAVRKTLPADVQNYYSRRGRNSSSPQSAWTRPEEAAPEQDPNFKDQTNQQGDSSQHSMNMLQPQMNVITPVNTQPQPMNIFPYPMGVPAPIMNIQHNPFSLPPPVPMHLHTGVPLVQVAAPTSVSQGPPPPPPPPPPSQQVNYVASQLDGKQLQAAPGASHVANNMSTPLVPAPSSALGSMEAIQGPSSGNATSSSNVKTSNAAVKLAESKVSVTVEASADSSKKDQKMLIQEKAAQEVKLAIKPYYQNKDITKEEYKEIVRKAVDKVCHSKSGEVNSAKVANLVKAYVDKYKHSRKKNPEEIVSLERK